MNSILKISMLIFFSLILTGTAFASDMKEMKGHDMKDNEMSFPDKIGTLVHESMVDGFMLSYYLMDLRDQKRESKDMSQNKKQMDKPHHIMVYIMDKKHKPVLKGTVGFVIKDDQGNAQKAMAMYMSEGFGITADMKKKGVYTITAKALLGDTKLVDSFTHEAEKKKTIQIRHWAAPSEERNRINPIPLSNESVRHGQTLYIQNCTDCHGINADGMGPDADEMEPRPSNLKAMAGHHSDGDMAWKIKRGRGPMPAWETILSEEQVWHLVNFIQNLKKND